jgi:type IV pilus assembly protein PilB
LVSFDKRVLKILEKADCLKDEELEESTRLVEEGKSDLCTVLVRQGYLNERDLLGLLATELKVPPIDLSQLTPDEKALESIPQDLATYYGIFPIAKIGNVLTIAVSNPNDVLKLDDIRIVTGCELRLVLGLEESLKGAIERAYNPGEAEMAEIFEGLSDRSAADDIELKENELDTEDLDINALMDGEGDSPVVKLVNLIVYQAIKEKASDIHIEPFEKRIRVRFRNDGICRETFSPPRKMLNSIVSRIKIMTSLDIAEKRKPQDGKFQMRVEGRQVDFRVSVLPVVHGEKVVIRILDAGNLALRLDMLGFERKALADFRSAVTSPYGMLLVTGPTGSGKSTTLYSAVKEVLSIESNFVTVEDPVEYQLEGVNQVQVHPKRGLTFASALRSILRQDPDVVMVGEIRDSETIEIAVKAALTGHLVLSTLHTNDAPSTVTRMIDMGVDPFMVASSTLLVAAQRLSRKLCAYCREPLPPPPAERLLRIGFREEEADAVIRGQPLSLPESVVEDGDEPEIIPQPILYRAKGCPRCTNGFAGRFALLETLPVTEEIRRIVIDGGSALDIKNRAVEQGMITLRRAGILNAIRGKTSIDEVLRVTMADRHRRSASSE